jgi:hypothetical protein
MSNGLKSILKIVSLRCEEADRMMSDSLDRRLGWAERVALNGHQLVCRSCRRARRQLLALRRAMRTSPDQGEALSTETRDRIRAALKSSG